MKKSKKEQAAKVGPVAAEAVKENDYEYKSRPLLKVLSTIEFNERVLDYTANELNRRRDPKGLEKMPEIVFKNILEVLKNDIALVPRPIVMKEMKVIIERIFNRINDLTTYHFSSSFTVPDTAERIIHCPTLRDVVAGKPGLNMSYLNARLEPGMFYLVEAAACAEESKWCELGTNDFDRADINLPMDGEASEFVILYAIPNERADFYEAPAFTPMVRVEQPISCVLALASGFSDWKRANDFLACMCLGVPIFVANGFIRSSDFIESKTRHMSIHVNRLTKCINPSVNTYPILHNTHKFLPDVPSIYESLLASGTDVIVRTPTPYNPYALVLKFIQQMCADDEIERIYATIYRVADDSFVLGQLLLAASRGAKVNLFIELHAHGDEFRNWAIYQRLRSLPNVHVYANTVPYKVHAKFFIGVGKGKQIAHIGTGNYNEVTGETYYDTQVFTMQHRHIRPLLDLFKTVSCKGGQKRQEEQKRLRKAVNVRNSDVNRVDGTIHSMIRKYAQYARDGFDVEAILKCNHINDRQIERAIVNAALDGVKFKLIVRTTCAIDPAKNIDIFYPAGINLEHDRIYLFRSSFRDIEGPPLWDLMISSADLATRNLSHRAESFYYTNNFLDEDSHNFEYLKEILERYCEPKYYQDIHITKRAVLEHCTDDGELVDEEMNGLIKQDFQAFVATVSKAGSDFTNNGVKWPPAVLGLATALGNERSSEYMHRNEDHAESEPTAAEKDGG